MTNENKLLPIKEVEWVKERIQDAAKIHVMNTSAKNKSLPLRPSSALKSERELYYGLVDFYEPGRIVKTPIEGRNAMLLSLGHAIERHFIEHIERAFAVTHRNIRVHYATIEAADRRVIELTGELDYVIESTKTGELIICDSKSSADFPFKSGVPKDEHIAQINLYIHSSWARERNINKSWIMYYNKNNSEIKIYEFEYSKQLAETIVNKFLKVLNSYISGVVPNREHVLGVDWQAAYSSYREHDNKEFTVPAEKRAKSKLKESEIEDLDRKELVKFLAIRPDSGNMFITAERRLWLELGATTLILKEDKLK